MPQRQPRWTEELKLPMFMLCYTYCCCRHFHRQHVCHMQQAGRPAISVVRRAPPINYNNNHLSPPKVSLLWRSGGLVWSHYPKSYAGGSVCPPCQTGQGYDPDKKGYPGPPGWGFGLGLTTPHSKKVLLRKSNKGKGWMDLTMMERVGDR
jgi:hypothetical protein